jgi:hypothetical protein
MVFDKLMFWKKEDDDLGLDHDMAKDPYPAPPTTPPLETPVPPPDSSFESPISGASHPAAFQSRSQMSGQPLTISPASQSGSLEKDVQLLLSKLDTIKALLDNINQRLTTLENQRWQEEKQSRRNYGW